LLFPRLRLKDSQRPLPRYRHIADPANRDFLDAETTSGCVHIAGAIISPNTTKVFTLAAIAALRQEN
jgi:hypothetical protein